MHRDVFREFERICAAYGAGGDVLEVGALPSADSLLCLEALANTRSKIGIHLGPPATFRDFRIVQANANDMRVFADASFDTVLSNSVLEHDRFFWRTLAEIRRVARPGALIAIGVPGFAKLRFERVLARMGRWPLAGRLLGGLSVSTLALQVHHYPGDYYRFTPQAVEEVFLEGLLDKEVRTVMCPPRIMGVGRLP